MKKLKESIKKEIEILQRRVNFLKLINKKANSLETALKENNLFDEENIKVTKKYLENILKEKEVNNKMLFIITYREDVTLEKCMEIKKKFIEEYDIKTIKIFKDESCYLLMIHDIDMFDNAMLSKVLEPPIHCWEVSEEEYFEIGDMYKSLIEIQYV